MHRLWLLVLLVALGIAAWLLAPAAPVGDAPVVAGGSIGGLDSRRSEAAASHGADATRDALPEAAGPAALPAVCQLRGTVRDELDQPVAEVDVVVRSGYELPFPTPFSLLARTGPDGGFAFPHKVPPGSWRLDVKDRVLTGPKAVQIGVGAPTATLDLRVEVRDARAVIAGVVVDHDGQPQPDVVVEARGEQGRYRITVRNGADGTFVLHCPGRAEGKVWLGWDRPDGVICGTGGDPVTWGTLGVRLEVGSPERARPQELDLLVVGPDGTTPVEEYCVRGTWRRGLLAAGRHPGGRVRLPVQGAQGHALFVHPADPDLIAAGPESIDAGDALRIQRAVKLRRATTLAVRVQRRDGTPVASERVELLRPWGDLGIAPQTRSVPLADPSALGALQVSQAVTDAQGIARLRAPAGETGLAVRVLGPHCVVRLVEDVSVPTAAAPPLVIVAEAGGTLRVRVRAGEQLAPYCIGDGTGAMVALTPYSLPLDPRIEPDTCWPLGADGTVQIGGVAAGAWDVRLLVWVRPSPLDPVTLWNPLPHQTVSFEHGETRGLEFDARQLVPGRLAARVMMGGDPLAHAPVDLQSLQPRQSLRVHAVTDSEGRFELPHVMPGRVWLQVEQLDPASGQSVWLHARGSPPLPPGGVLQREFHVEVLR